ncbi:uncharacterized protein LOC144650879 [Oculina patagonica]
MKIWLYTVLLSVAILVWKPKDAYSLTCDFDVQASGEFISCDSSKYCETFTWSITAPPHSNIRLKFDTFQLSDSSYYGQNWIHIYDGRNTNSTMLGAFTGARRPFNIQSSGRFMLVKLIKQLDWGYSLCNFNGVYTFSTAKDKPRILISNPVVRAAPGHFVWCSTEGSPPINISILKNSVSLATGIGTVMSQLYEGGSYTCVARNEAGSDTRDFTVTIVDCGNLCVSQGNITNGQVENDLSCSSSDSSVDIFKCLPTTSTKLAIRGSKITYLPKEAFLGMVALKILDLKDNEIEELPEEIFSDLFSLQELYLTGNKIHNLPRNVFSALASLQYLSLTRNKIQRLPPEIFSNLSKLLSLSLEGNKIENLTENVFSALMNLRFL